ncbi:MAG: DUF3299 domain-containing protein [Candidatus Hydrogenedentes bacterium]|nr:DUF3299 domain-containing protein [Candidatus Hydrogenedentota bacterium]
MRRRVVRDLGTIIGVVVILAAVVGINFFMRLEGLQAKYEKIRRQYEAQAAQAGTDVLDWQLLRKTKGSLRAGATFPEDLLPKAGQIVNLMGFTTPIDQFRAATHFMLLPLPIECYFCQAPPMRDVMLVHMAEGEATDMYEEPVMLTGRLVLNEGKGQQFFYTLEDASVTSKGGTATKSYSKQHRQEGQSLGKGLDPSHAGAVQEMPKEQLLPPAEAPQAPTQAPAPAP